MPAAGPGPCSAPPAPSIMPPASGWPARPLPPVLMEPPVPPAPASPPSLPPGAAFPPVVEAIMPDPAAVVPVVAAPLPLLAPAELPVVSDPPHAAALIIQTAKSLHSNVIKPPRISIVVSNEDGDHAGEMCT